MSRNVVGLNNSVRPSHRGRTQPTPPGALDASPWINGDADYRNWGINTANIVFHIGDANPYRFAEMYPGARKSDRGCRAPALASAHKGVAAMFQLLGLLFVAGAIVLVARWLLITAAISLALRLLIRALRAWADAERRRDRELAALRARADQQHEWVMQGDDCGVLRAEPAGVGQGQACFGP